MVLVLSQCKSLSLALYIRLKKTMWNADISICSRLIALTFIHDITLTLDLWSWSSKKLGWNYKISHLSIKNLLDYQVGTTEHNNTMKCNCQIWSGLWFWFSACFNFFQLWMDFFFYSSLALWFLMRIHAQLMRIYPLNSVRY